MKKKTILIFFVALAALALAVLADGLWCNNTVGASVYKIKSEKLNTRIRVTQVSDLHNAEFGKNNSRLLERIRRAEPDIIAITGDIIDASRTDVDVALGFAKEAAKIAPCYYVAGNHEARSGRMDELEKGLTSAGVTVLRDKTVAVQLGGSSIKVAGIDDPMFERMNGNPQTDTEIAERKLVEIIKDSSSFTLLLSHRPELLETYAAFGVDVVLTGHAHGGQVRLPFVGGIIAPNQGFFPKYDSGLYKSGGTSMFVSRGLGNSIVPLRINDRAELVTVEIN